MNCFAKLAEAAKASSTKRFNSRRNARWQSKCYWTVILLRGLRKRFEREIELVASLKHPNIIAVFDSGTTPDGYQYYVMDYVRGLPITEYVRQHQLSLDEALKLFSLVCTAVNHAHQKGIIHRDLKPSNVLVDSDAAPRMLDFGLAKTLAGSEVSLFSQTGQVVGTLPYMSPEQTAGNPDAIDTRTDVYSLGVILYEMLTGTSPYPVDGTIVDIFRHITQTEPLALVRSWSPDAGIKSPQGRAGKCPLDQELGTIASKALAKARDRRYQSAGELSRDVSNYLAGAPLDAKRDSALYLLSKALRRNKLPVATAVAFIVLIVGSTIALSILYSRQSALLADVQRESAAALTAQSRAQSAAIHEAEQRQQAQSQSQLYRLSAARAAVEVKDYPVARKILIESPVPAELQDDWRWAAWSFLHSSREVANKDLVPWFPAEERSYLLQGDSHAYPTYLDLENHRVVVVVATKQFAIDLATGQRAPLELSAAHPLNIPGIVVDSVSKLNQARAGPLKLSADLTVSLGIKLDGGGQILLADGAQPTNTVTVTQEPSACAISHDGKMVAVGFATGRINGYSLDTTLTGSLALTPIFSIRGYREAVASIAFSQDDQQIHAISDGMMYRVWLWNATPDVTQLHAHSNTIRHIAFSPDSTLVATAAYDGRVKIFDTRSHLLVKEIAAHVPKTPNFGTLCFFPDGKHLLTSGSDSVNRIWDLSSLAGSNEPEKIARRTNSGWFNRWIGLTIGEPVVKVDAPLSEFFVGHTSRGQISPDGSTVYTTNGFAWEDRVSPKLEQWDVHDLRHPHKVADFDSTPGIYAGYNLRYLPDQHRLIAVNSIVGGGGDVHKACQVYDTTTTPPTPLAIIDDGDVDHRDLDVSPDGSLLALSTWQGTVSLWDWQQKRRLTTLQVNPGRSSTSIVSSVRFHPTLPLLAAACHDSRVNLFSSQTYRQLATIDVDPERQLAYGAHGPLKEAVFSPDGKILAIGAGNDLWLVDLSFFKHQIQQLAQERESLADRSPDISQPRERTSLGN